MPSNTFNRSDPALPDSCDTFLVNTKVEHDHLDLVSRFSSFRKLFLTYRYVLLFINNLKRKVQTKFLEKFKNLSNLDSNHNFFAEARKVILRQWEYFHSHEKLLKDMPKIVGQINVYLDEEGLLRVRSKMDRLKYGKRYRFPILLSKESPLTKLIILHYHDDNVRL